MLIDKIMGILQVRFDYIIKHVGPYREKMGAFPPFKYFSSQTKCYKDKDLLSL